MKGLHINGLASVLWEQHLVQLTTIFEPKSLLKRIIGVHTQGFPLARLASQFNRGVVF